MRALRAREFLLILACVKRRLRLGAAMARRVVLPDGVERIGPYCFYRSSLRGVVVPGSVTSIGRGAFALCTLLRDLHICEGSRLGTIQKEAFAGSGLEEVCVPAALREVGPGAFAGCERLRVAEVEHGGGTALRIRAAAPDTAIVVEAVCRKDGEQRITELEAKNAEIEALKRQLKEEREQKSKYVTKCTQLEKELKQSHDELTKFRKRDEEYQKRGILVVPEGTETISEGQLQENGARYLLIPKCIREIRERAFKGWKNLRAVVFEEESQVRKIEKEAFSDCSNLRSV